LRDAYPIRVARNAPPEPHGEGYLFVVDEYWRICEQHAGHLLLRAQSGKTLLTEVTDPHLHVVSWWERLFYRHRFPKSDISSSQGTLLT